MHVGTITQLQVQRSSLKTGEGKARYYDPSPIQRVSHLDLDPGGVVGREEDGKPIIDVHHAEHPMTKNRNGDNGISIGFVTHYALMREHLGDHLANGLAGENILIETSESFVCGDLPERLVIETVDDREMELVNVQVAEPCVEFTRFAMQFPRDARPDSRVTEALDFLRRGMRGYYATYLGAPARVSLGSRLYISSG